jgi:hypothetical protein
LAVVQVLPPGYPTVPAYPSPQMNNRQIVTPRLLVLGASQTRYLVKWRGYSRVEDLTCEPRHNVHVPVAYVPSIDQSAPDYRVCACAYRAPDHNAPFASGPTGSTACELPAALPAGHCSVPPPHLPTSLWRPGLLFSFCLCLGWMIRCACHPEVGRVQTCNLSLSLSLVRRHRFAPFSGGG